MDIQTKNVWAKSQSGLLVYACFLGKKFNLSNPSKRNYHNPFYNDKNPSLSIFWSKEQQKWLHKDHGDPNYMGDAIDFANHHYKLDKKKQFPLLLQRIMEDLEKYKSEGGESLVLKLNRLNSYQKQREMRADRPKHFELNIIDFTKEGVDYWDDLGVPTEILNHYSVVQIDGYVDQNYNDWIIPKGELAFAFKHYEGAKIYRPNHKKYKWMSVGESLREYLFGVTDNDSIYWKNSRYKNYDDENRRIPLIIAAGQKDTLVLIANGYAAVCLNSENSDLDWETYKEWKVNDGFDIYSTYDIDSTGLRRGQKLKKDFDVTPIPFFNRGQRRKFYNEHQIKINDISDYFLKGLDMERIQYLIEEFNSDNSSNQTKNSKRKEDSSPNEDLHKPYSKVIEVSEPIEASKNGVDNLPKYFDESIYDPLPPFLKRYTDLFNDRQTKDLVLLSSIISFGSICHRINGNYYGKDQYANLFGFIYGSAASGKSEIKYGKELINKVNNYLFKKSIRQLEEYNSMDKDDKKDTEKPQRRYCIYSANSSATQLIKNIANNFGFGLLYEEEADIIGNMMANEWANLLSDILRKGNEGETLMWDRASVDLPTIIEKVFLSVLISGTPNQIKTLINSYENGLLSRFLFYRTYGGNFKNPFSVRRPSKSQSLNFQNSVFNFWVQQNNLIEDITFEMTEEQQNRVYVCFKETFELKTEIFGEDIESIVLRLGANFFRIAMGISSFRLLDKEKLPSKLICTDEDFEVAMKMTQYFIQHSINVFASYPKQQSQFGSLSGNAQQLYEELPIEFQTPKAKEVAKKIGISKATYERYLNKYIALGILVRLKKSHYQKVTHSE